MSLGLVVMAEDDPELRSVLSARCESLGLEVEACADAMSALQMITSRKPQIVILDVDMPQGSGLGVCEMMARHTELATIPVIMLTGKRDAETVSRCYSLGTYFVPKCSDVWPRIERLLVDLLELDEAKSRCDGPHCGKTDVSSALGATPCDATHDVLDNVFTALGAIAPLANESEDDVEPWVLCIDDDAELLDVLKLRFQQQGVKVRTASAGRPGYRTAFTNSASAITLDYQMADGDGLYVLRRLKESRATRDIPVIVLTGCRDSRLERHALEAGAAAFLGKPCPWADLWRVVQPLIEQTRHARQASAPELAAASAR